MLLLWLCLALILFLIAREVVTAAPAGLDDVAACAVLYMGLPYPVAKRYRNVWYQETPDGFVPFAFQGRVRPVIEPQRGPKG